MGAQVKSPLTQALQHQLFNIEYDKTSGKLRK